MITITVVSMLFNILLTGALYFIIHGDKYDNRDLIIMKQSVRINELTRMVGVDKLTQADGITNK